MDAEFTDVLYHTEILVSQSILALVLAYVSGGVGGTDLKPLHQLHYYHPPPPPVQLLPLLPDPTTWICRLRTLKDSPRWFCHLPPRGDEEQSSPGLVCVFKARRWSCSESRPKSPPEMEQNAHKSFPTQIASTKHAPATYPEPSPQTCLEELRCLPKFLCGSFSSENASQCLRNFASDTESFPTAVFLPPKQCSLASPRCNITREALKYLQRHELNRDVFDFFRHFIEAKPEDTCLEELGCFEARPCDLFIPLGYTVPDPSRIGNTSFTFHGPGNSTQGKVLHTEPVPTNVTRMFSSQKELIVIIHGFRQSIGDVINGDLRDALRATHPSAILMEVDWARAANHDGGVFYYNRAAGNAFAVAKQSVRMILRLKAQVGLALNATKIYGFSLGAQIAGLTGRGIFNETGELIGKIIALDPAGPGFCPHKISPGPGSAMETRVLHTDIAKGAKVIAYGCEEPGDISFYVNGGKKQPGCFSVFGMAPQGCFHNFAMTYFVNHLLDPDRCPIKGNLCQDNENPLENLCRGEAIDFRSELTTESRARPQKVFVDTQNLPEKCLA